MGVFRRRPRGRHALGAPLAAAPDGVLAPLPAVPAPPPAPAPASFPVVSGLVGEIAQLIATGEAWAVPVEEVLDFTVGTGGGPDPALRQASSPVAPAPVVPPTPVLPPVPVLSPVAAPAPAPAVLMSPAPVPPPTAAPVVHGPVPAPVVRPVPPAPEVVAAPARVAPATPAPASAVPAARTDAAVPPAAVVAAAVSYVPVSTVPQQAGHRVELGFRDGSTAALDPDSEQALALAELSQLLTGRD